MVLLRNISALCFIFLLTAFTDFHHGWADYDQTKTLDYTGTIEESVYENPHATIKLKYQKKVWQVILAPTTRMTDRGVTPEMIKKGKTIRVIGYPHKEVKNEMRSERIFVEGTKYELR